jgi:hypothetical protein
LASRKAAATPQLKLSGLQHHKTLDEFDVSFRPELEGSTKLSHEPDRSQGVGPIRLVADARRSEWGRGARAACRSGVAPLVAELDLLLRGGLA